MLYRHHPDPPQVRHRCRNPRCSATSRSPPTIAVTRFAAGAASGSFMAAAAGFASAVLPENPRAARSARRLNAGTSFSTIRSNILRSRPITPQNASIAHNAHPNPLKMGVKSTENQVEACDIIAGPRCLTSTFGFYPSRPRRRTGPGKRPNDAPPARC